MDTWTRRSVLGAGTTPFVLAAALGCERGGARSDAAARLTTAPVTITAQITDMNAAMVNSWPAEMAAPYKQRRPNVTIEWCSCRARRRW